MAHAKPIQRRTSKRIQGLKSFAADDLPTVYFPHDRRDWPTVQQSIAGITTMGGMISFISSRHNVSITPLAMNLTAAFEQLKLPEPVFVETILPWLVHTAVNHGKFLPKLTALYARTNITLTQRQSASIVVLMWFGLCSYDFILNDSIQNYPYPKFDNIFRGCTFGLCALVSYFMRMICRDTGAAAAYAKLSQYMPGITLEPSPVPLIDLRKIVYMRSSDAHPSCGRVSIVPKWLECSAPLGEVQFCQARVDDSLDALIQTVPCQAILGGRTFTQDTGDMLYEDVIFCVRPDCLPLLMLAPTLEADTIAVVGAEKYSQYNAMTPFVQGIVSYGGHFQESDEQISTVRLVTLFYDLSRSVAPIEQLQKNWSHDMAKLYIGMSAVIAPGAVAVQHPTTRGIGGDIELRFLQMWLAASAAGRTLIYHSASNEFESVVEKFYNYILDNAASVADELSGSGTAASTDPSRHPTVADVMCIYKAMLRARLSNRRTVGINLFREMMSI